MDIKFRVDKHNGFYTTINGKRFTGKTKEIIIEKIKAAGRLSDIIPTSKLTVKDAFESYLPYIKNNKLDGTYTFYLYIYEYHFLGIKRDKNKEIIFSQPFEVQGKPLIDYRIANLDEWLMKTIYETLEKEKTKGNNPVSLRSVHHYFTTFKSAITYIYNKNRRHFDVNPSELYNKSYKMRRVWCPDKPFAIEVLNAVDKYCSPVHSLFTHLCAMGLRSGEACALKVSDFYLSSPKPFVKIERMLTHKSTIQNRLKNNDEERFVYLGANIIERIRKVIIGKKSNDYLFESPVNKGHPYCHTALKKYGIKKALKKIGKESEWKGSVHVLRHYYASVIIGVASTEKKSFKWIPKQLGHSQFSTTMEIYGHLIDGDEDDIGDVIEASLYS